MIEKTLKNGFNIILEDEALDDYEILMAFNAMDKDQRQIGRIDDVYVSLLGEEQYEALREHIRNENGRVRASEMVELLDEIMALDDETKNS